MKDGLVTIDTARSQALLGFLNETAHDFPHLGAQLENPFAAVLLTSLDDRPVAEAEQWNVPSERLPPCGKWWRSIAAPLDSGSPMSDR